MRHACLGWVVQDVSSFNPMRDGNACLPFVWRSLLQSNQEMPDVMPSMDFKRVWQSNPTAAGGAAGRGARDARVLSIWRPVGPPGYSSLGDVAVAGSEPPSGKPVKMYKDVMGAGDAPGQVRSGFKDLPGPSRDRKCLAPLA